MSSNIILIPVLTPGVAWQTEQNGVLKAIFLLRIDTGILFLCCPRNTLSVEGSFRKESQLNENPYTARRAVSYVAVPRLLDSSECPL